MLLEVVIVVLLDVVVPTGVMDSLGVAMGAGKRQQESVDLVCVQISVHLWCVCTHVFVHVDMCILQIDVHNMSF